MSPRARWLNVACIASMASTIAATTLSFLLIRHTAAVNSAIPRNKIKLAEFDPNATKFEFSAPKILNKPSPVYTHTRKIKSAIVDILLVSLTTS
jgi:hypothetical protein